MPVVPTRESKIYWFNWREVLEWYADQNDDSLYDKTVKLANLIRIKAGRGNLISTRRVEQIVANYIDEAGLQGNGYHVHRVGRGV